MNNWWINGKWHTVLILRVIIRNNTSASFFNLLKYIFRFQKSHNWRRDLSFAYCSKTLWVLIQAWEYLHLPPSHTSMRNHLIINSTSFLRFNEPPLFDAHLHIGKRWTVFCIRRCRFYASIKIKCRCQIDFRFARIMISSVPIHTMKVNLFTFYLFSAFVFLHSKQK